MEEVCEILWRRSEGEKNMTLIMCIEQPIVSKNNNTVFFNEFTGNLSKFNKNSTKKNKTSELIVNNI